MLREAADLGFTHVELSHGVRITLVPGVLRAVEEGIIRVSSVHNFCPLPTGIGHPAPNLFEPSAGGREHEQWLRQTRRTLDFAVQMEAKAMVLHLGSVRFFWFHPDSCLRDFRRKNPAADIPGDPAYRALLDKSLAKVRKRLPDFWERTRQSIDEILPYAAEKGVRLGCENRERIEELPLDADFPELFSNLSAPAQAGYWHDTGHADLKEKMGLINHREHLAANAEKLVGFHLHDVDADGHDHQPVGTGRVDFEMVRDFWRPHHLLVLELSPGASRDDVIESRRQIENLM